MLLTDVWVYDEDRWRVVRRHSSPAPARTARPKGGAIGDDRRAKTASRRVKELTLRGIILGALITLVFTAANVYLGLKIGLTFATSIPAAVISMAVLKFFADSTIQENNIVQTIASAAGTLSAIIFVLPGLIMVGWWTGFPFWLSVAVIAHRRHPRRDVLGAAAARAGDRVRPALSGRRRRGRSAEGRRGRRRRGGKPARPGADHLELDRLGGLSRSSRRPGLPWPKRRRTFRVGTGATTVSASLSMALIGVGHLVGMAVGIAMLVGLIISWFVLVPLARRGLAGPGRRRHRDLGRHGLPREGPLHRRRRDRRRGDLDPAQDHRADHRAASVRRSPPAARAAPAAQDSLAADRARHPDRHRRRRRSCCR